MTVKSANVHVFGHDDDALYLGPSGVDLSKVGLTTDIPKELLDCGWLSEDGATLGMKDSTKAIQGHQGHANVLVFMDSSETTFEATLLESRLQTFLWNLSAAAKKVGDYTEIAAKSSRQVVQLCGIWDTFDTQHEGVHWRYIFNRISLGERDDIAFKVGEISAYKYSLNVLEGFRILTNAEAMQVGSPEPAPVPPVPPVKTDSL